MKRLILLVVLTLLGANTNALAWNARGHMMVAAVAWQHMTPQSRDRASALLKLNPDYKKWVAGVAAAKQDEIAFVKASTWADAIKSEHGYKNDGEDATVANADLNVGYSDHLQHRYWHYIDLPFSTDGTPLINPKGPNVRTRIGDFRRVIRSQNQTDDVRSYDLVWLIHLVGDIHQPLHATSRFSKKLPKGDSGGNDVKICTPTCGGSLHAFWDDILGTSSSVDAAITAARKLAVAPTTAAAMTNQRAWSQESFAIAKASVYVSPIGAGAGPFTITAAYRAKARSIAEKQVALAGARLAELINVELR
jgi:S1/P1 Nuclease